MRDSRFQGIWFSVLSRFCYGYNPTLFKKKNKMLNARFIFVECCRVEIQVLQSDELNFSHNHDNWILGFGQWKVRDFVCLRERDTSGSCYCGLESLLYEKLFFHCRHPIAPPLFNLYPRYSASILQRKKRLRLVHLPLVLSARKP